MSVIEIVAALDQKMDENKTPSLQEEKAMKVAVPEDPNKILAKVLDKSKSLSN